METELLWKVKEGADVKLKDYDPGYIAKNVTRDSAQADLKMLTDELNELQELMAAAHSHSLLMLLQGMDTSGKDGTIRHVLSGVNPQSCSVYAFKEPTEEELAHDFLWRVHKVTPGKGSMSVFNRSHYEDVLIVRVHNLAPKDVWSRRYKEIIHFENLLAASNTIILKFFLHISSDEQEQRLLAREQHEDKAWKISVSDWTERRYWNDYQKAYEEALSKCSSTVAPWYIVPANHKWYRNLAITQALVETMQPYKGDWKESLQARGQKELEAIEQMRAAQQSSPS